MKQQRFNLSQLWRLEVQNPGVSRATLPLKSAEEKASCLFQLPESPGVPRSGGASIPPLPLFPHGLLLWVSVPLSSYEDKSHWI